MTGVAFVDTETLGLRARTHAIWEIAIILPGDGRSAESVLLADERDLGRLFRLAASRLHPDAGGDPERFRRLVEARDLLLGRL